MRRLEAPPQLIGLRPRHIGRLPPLLLKLADLAGNRLGIVERAKRLHLRAEPLLDGDVRPALPLIGFAELLHFRRQRRQQRLEAARDIVVILLAWQLRHSPQRRSNVAQGAIGRLQRQIGTRRERFDAAEQMLHAGERFAPRLGVGRSRLGLARHHLVTRHRRSGRPVPLRQSTACSEIAPFTPREPEALARCREVRIRGGRHGGVRELRQPEVGARSDWRLACSSALARPVRPPVPPPALPGSSRPLPPHGGDWPLRLPRGGPVPREILDAAGPAPAGISGSRHRHARPSHDGVCGAACKAASRASRSSPRE